MPKNISNVYMKKVFIILLFLYSSLFTQVKLWKQTTAADFISGTLDRVSIDTVGDGELQLIHPLVQVGKDTLDSDTRFRVSYDEAGNYIQGWIASKKVFVQKFNKQRQSVSDVINVDEKSSADGSMVGVALLNDGRFTVSWAEYFDSSNGFSYSLRYCQFFDGANAKIGKNVRIFNVSNATHSIPRPIADQINKRFLIVGTEGNSSKGFQSYGWLFDPSGVKLRDSIKIIPSSLTKNEYHIHGVYHNGKFAFIWDGSDDNTGPDDTYFVLADSNGVLLTSLVIANTNAPQGSSPAAAFDLAGNCLVTWTWNSFSIPGPPGIVFGQVFDFNGKKIGACTQLTSIKVGAIDAQDISFLDGLYRITYGIGFSNGQPIQRYASHWKLSSIHAGRFTSKIFDAGSQQTSFHQISWNGISSTGTCLKFLLRSAVSQEDIESAVWIGPQSGSFYYTNGLGETINSATNMKRYLQAKAFFESDTVGRTPVLNDFTVTYIVADSLVPGPVSNVTARGEHRRIHIGWTKSTSDDVKSYRIYRAIAGEKFDMGSFIVQSAQNTSFADSSVMYDVQYHYGITAVDSTFNESDFMVTDNISPKTMKIFVSASVDMSGDGTSAKPFLTIKDGITYSFRGDTVYVMPGEYTEDIILKEGIALIGSGAPTTKIISSSSSGAVQTALGTIVQGFTLLVARGIVVKGNYSTISENILIHQGPGFDVGIFPGSNEHVVISKNILMNFAINIQAVALPSPPKYPIVIRNNIIIGSTGVQNVRSNLKFVNNTFVVNGSGIAISIGTGTTVLLNNCFAGYPSEGNYVRSVLKPFSGTFQFEYNNRWNFNGDQTDTVSPSNISVDPFFINVAKNNYHLESRSLCNNAGDPSTDYNDKDGSRNDIGAYGGPDPLPEFLTFALTTELSLKGGTGFPGDTISVEINLSRAAGVQNAGIEIHFDQDIVQFINAKTTALTTGFSISVRTEQSGKRYIQIEGSSEIPSGSGTIAMLRFNIDPSLSGARHSAIEIGEAELRDGGNNRIIVSMVSNGMMVVKSLQTFPHRVFVDGSFSGVSDGTIFHPYVTIQDGVNNAKDDDTVFVAAGIYNGPISMKNNIFVKGSGAGVTTITAPIDPLINIPTAVRFNAVKNTGISGFNLVNERSLGTVIEVISSDAEIAMNKIDQSGMAMYTVMVFSGSHVTIRDNYFIESKYGGSTMLNVSSDDAIITRNIFSPSTASDIIMVTSGDRASITNNRFLRSKEGVSAITMMNSKRSMVANNLFSGSGSAGSAIKFFNAESTNILNNIFDVGSTGVNINSGYHFIENNVFYGNSIGINTPVPTVHRYNLFWKNSIDVNNGILDVTELSDDPQFVDREKGNYRPSPMSVMRNAGDPSAEWNDNDGTRNDIGIYGGPFADSMMFISSNIRLRIGSVSGRPGDTVRIPVIASGVIGMSGMNLMIDFDSQRLQLLSVHTTPATRSFAMVRKNIGQSIVNIEMNGSESVTVDSASIAELTMLIQPQASGDAFVNFQNVYVISGAAQIISVQYTENGMVDLTPSSVNGNDVPAPEQFFLAQNFPNPFNPLTTIGFTLQVSGLTTLKIYDILGKEIAILVNENLQAGVYHQRMFNASNHASGIYIARLQCGKAVQYRKMVFIK